MNRTRQRLIAVGYSVLLPLTSAVIVVAAAVAATATADSVAQHLRRGR